MMPAQPFLIDGFHIYNKKVKSGGSKAQSSDIIFEPGLIHMGLCTMAHMLLGRHMSIKESADACGFSDEKYFSRIFKKKISIPPSYFTDRKKIWTVHQ